MGVGLGGRSIRRDGVGVAADSEADGGDIDLTAGDDIQIDRNIDVSAPTNGGGGGITARAGVDRAGGVKVGGSLTVTGNLFANGSNDADGGYDGGEIELRAFGPVTVSGALRASAQAGQASSSSCQSSRPPGR
jgi:hypothetical protein